VAYFKVLSQYLLEAIEVNTLLSVMISFTEQLKKIVSQLRGLDQIMDLLFSKDANHVTARFLHV
jgi:hypothetical protein